MPIQIIRISAETDTRAGSSSHYKTGGIYPEFPNSLTSKMCERRASCHGCKVSSQNGEHHSYPGGCEQTVVSPSDGQHPCKWLSRLEVYEGTHPLTDSLGNWIDVLEKADHCPILVSTQTISFKEKDMMTFTLFYPGVFPNDYQTFYSVACVNSFLENTPDLLPVWAMFTRNSTANGAYHGRFLKLTEEQAKAFLPQ